MIIRFLVGGEVGMWLMLNLLQQMHMARDVLVQPAGQNRWQQRERSRARLFLTLDSPCKRGISNEEISQGLRSGL